MVVQCFLKCCMLYVPRICQDAWFCSELCAVLENLIKNFYSCSSIGLLDLRSHHELLVIPGLLFISYQPTANFSIIRPFFSRNFLRPAVFWRLIGQAKSVAFIRTVLFVFSLKFLSPYNYSWLLWILIFKLRQALETHESLSSSEARKSRQIGGRS